MKAGGAIDPPAFTVGDEFQGSYPSVGAAIDAGIAALELVTHGEGRRVDRAAGDFPQSGGAIDPPAFTVGDEFQGSYPRVGAAIDAALTVRLLLAPEPEADVDLGGEQ
ncbi:hypothetical protein MAHJHV28_46960 [Mycobacterium avium subsp. hominissuis]